MIVQGGRSLAGHGQPEGIKIMSVSLAKPLQPVGPFDHIRTRQWVSTVELAVETGWNRVYDRLCENDLHMLQVTFAAKIHRSEGRREVSDHLYDVFGSGWSDDH